MCVGGQGVGGHTQGGIGHSSAPRAALKTFPSLRAQNEDRVGVLGEGPQEPETGVTGRGEAFSLKTLPHAPSRLSVLGMGTKTEEEPSVTLYFPKKGREVALKRHCPHGLDNWKAGTVDAAPG